MSKTMPNPQKTKKNKLENDHEGSTEFSGQPGNDDIDSAEMVEQQLEDEKNILADSPNTGDKSSTQPQGEPICETESDPGKQDAESALDQDPEALPDQDTESALEQDPEALPDQDTESALEQDPETLPNQDTESALEQDPEALPDQDTESALDQDPETLPDQDAESALDQDPEALPDQDAESALDQDPETLPDQDAESALDQDPETLPDQDTESSSEKNGFDEPSAETSYSENMLKAAGVEFKEDLSPRMISIIESLLFVSDKPLPIATLCRVLDEGGTKKIKQALKAIKLIRIGSGINLVEVAGGYQLRTNPENAQWIRKLNPEKPARLSRAALETLAITAYRQPVTRADIDEIRGVDSGGVLRVLLERNLLKILGKKQEPGRPLLYGTSKEFLSFFGLKDLSDLPSLREFRELSEDNKEKLEEEEMERFSAMQEQFMKNTNQEQSNENIFAALAASSKKPKGEHNKPDQEIEKAFDQVNDATKKARRVQKELSRVGVLENEKEGKETRENLEASSDGGVSSSETGSLEDIARRHTETATANSKMEASDVAENNDKNHGENSTPNNETNNAANSAENNDNDADD